MKLALIVGLIAGSACAFAPSTKTRRRTFAPQMSESVLEASEESDTVSEEVAEPLFPTINGWTADPNAFCAGLPGATSPLGNFDPLGFTKGVPVQEIKRFREAEVTHGRVSMLAVVGYLVGENFHPFFNGLVDGPANSHLAQVQEIAPFFFAWLATSIATAELGRALKGWANPVEAFNFSFENDQKYGALLKDDYYPGDLGFDPLGLKPTDPEEFAIMQTRELNNGRLAMFAAIGFMAQELVTNEPILTTLLK